MSITDPDARLCRKGKTLIGTEVGIRERVRRLGGDLALAAEPGGGTRLTIELQAAGPGSATVSRLREMEV